MINKTSDADSVKITVTAEKYISQSRQWEGFSVILTVSPQTDAYLSASGGGQKSSLD